MFLFNDVLNDASDNVMDEENNIESDLFDK